ncbi:MAG: hypothetical protein ABS86_03485 [Sphingobium sp. SCN 64-10]|nr:MAG: hypothetical protein ABS86_03485 [Sphingobium sp. SCN 64-10]
MSIQDAATILQRLGPRRIAMDIAAEAELARELALLGCEIVDGAAAAHSGARSAGFLAWERADTGAAFTQALRSFDRLDTLILHSAGQPRHAIEPALFAAGWQRHPAGMMIGDYGAWSQYALPPLTFYQRAPKQGGGFLQQGSVEADALIARYALAATQVRPGDRVLIDGAGSSEGAAILAAQSRAGEILTVGPGTRQIAPDLASLADQSVDMIVAFAPSLPGDWTERLADFARVLKFDGRLLLGWRRTPGTNDGPQDWGSLVEMAGELFLPEHRFIQAPFGADPGGAHGLYPVPVEQEAGGDWLILSATANPLAGEGQSEGFDHPAFPKANGPWPALVDFGAAYDNPWLYRAMVQMGERLGHDLKLARLAECVIENSAPGSADRGAAIAVLGYRILELRLTNLADTIVGLIAAYLDEPVTDDTAAHVRRWRISLAFLAGKLHELTGDRDGAKAWYRRTAQTEWEGFSPLLTTKSIAACFFEARLWLAEGDADTAKARFREGLDIALKAVAFPHAEQLGPQNRPLPFYMQELAEVIDMGSQCANALANMPLWERDPGLFWRQVDIRRFGLASWARDLERENNRLRAA